MTVEIEKVPPLVSPTIEDFFSPPLLIEAEIYSAANPGKRGEMLHAFQSQRLPTVDLLQATAQ